MTGVDVRAARVASAARLVAATTVSVGTSSVCAWLVTFWTSDSVAWGIDVAAFTGPGDEEGTGEACEPQAATNIREISRATIRGLGFILGTRTPPA